LKYQRRQRKIDDVLSKDLHIEWIKYRPLYGNIAEAITINAMLVVEMTWSIERTPASGFKCRLLKTEISISREERKARHAEFVIERSRQPPAQRPILISFVRPA
jgi:hypothetical protein